MDTITIVVMKVYFGSMAKHEANAAKGDLFTTGKKYMKKLIMKEKRKKVKYVTL